MFSVCKHITCSQSQNWFSTELDPYYHVHFSLSSCERLESCRLLSITADYSNTVCYYCIYYLWSQNHGFGAFHVSQYIWKILTRSFLKRTVITIRYIFLNKKIICFEKVYQMPRIILVLFDFINLVHVKF